MAWQQPKTTWGQAGQTVPGVADFNRIEGNILHLEAAAGAVQAELETHLEESAQQAHLAKNILVQDLEGNFTSNPKNVENVLKEVFLSGNNVKVNTVGALLSVDPNLPLTSESSWNDIIAQIGNISTSNIKSIQTGTAVISQGASVDITINAVDTTKSVVFASHAGETFGASVLRVMVLASFLTNTKIRLETSESAFDHSYRWYVIEFKNIKSFQFITSTSGAHPRNVAINAVNINKTLVFASIKSPSGTGISGYMPLVLFPNVYLLNSTTLYVPVWTTNDVVNIHVVEFN